MIASRQIHGVEVAVISLDTSIDGLTDAQLADVGSLKLPKRQTERAAVYMLVNKFISEGLLIGHHESGEPYLVSESKPGTIPFSLSHSAHYAAIAFSRDGNLSVGVDIEEASPRIERVASKFLTDEESSLLSTPQLKLAAWTLKEAVFKASHRPDLVISDVKITRFTSAENEDKDALPFVATWEAELSYETDTPKFDASTMGLPGAMITVARISR